MDRVLDSIADKKRSTPLTEDLPAWLCADSQFASIFLTTHCPTAHIHLQNASAHPLVHNQNASTKLFQILCASHALPKSLTFEFYLQNKLRKETHDASLKPPEQLVQASESCNEFLWDSFTAGPFFAAPGNLPPNDPRCSIRWMGTVAEVATH